ncbi:MAG TPA: hypothetical protein DCL43_09220, partial [Chitinophagaceae bacterium]|nr:hypothetical protein [Chitinophagaceae bacterium]
PYKRHAEAIELAEALNWHLAANMLVQQTPQHNYFRTMLLWRSNSAVPANLTTLAIQDKGKYTPAFSALLQPYYLNL